FVERVEMRSRQAAKPLSRSRQANPVFVRFNRLRCERRQWRISYFCRHNEIEKVCTGLRLTTNFGPRSLAHRTHRVTTFAGFCWLELVYDYRACGWFLATALGKRTPLALSSGAAWRIFARCDWLS